MREAIDVFCHFLPPEYCAAVNRIAGRSFMFGRAQSIPAMVNLEARLRVMDAFPGYQQIPSIASPSPENMATPAESPELARIANDAFAEIVAKHPDRFRSFVATLPLNNPEASLLEADRACRQLGAAGVQVFTSVCGQALDQPQFLAIFGLMAELNRAVWLHPVRPMTTPDYPTEKVSKFDLWWALGWPHETSVAMGRLVFSGLFDHHPDLAIIAHHAGGTIPMMAGRLGAGLDLLGTRTPPDQAAAIKTSLREKPLAALRRFYADTATFGSRPAIECGAAFFGWDRMLFATDMPFDPEQGPGFIRATLKALDEASLTDAQRDAVLSANARRVLRLKSSA
ncbi:MAG: amidohydrolase [Verrucomicrobiales bacterium]|nr:amidohydrolase [Verrucomicrobiales bacterium]